MSAAVVLCLALFAPQLTCAHTNSKEHWPDVQHLRKLLGQRYAVKSSISKFTESGQIAWVSVHDSSGSTSTSTSKRSEHLLALYPSPSDPTTTVPFSFLNISSTSPTYVTTGKATVPIKLLNFRTPGFILRLVSNGTFYPVILAESAVITNNVINAPGQVHLAQHADGHSVVVQWVSGSSVPQQLHYSTTNWREHTTSSSSSSSTNSRGSSRSHQRNDIAHSIASTSITYSQEMMCGVPANSFGFLDPGYLHSAVIPASDVGFGKRLFYRVGSNTVGWSPLHSFTSPPSASGVASGKAPFTFLVFNDVGQENAVLFDEVCPPYCPAGWAFVNYTANSTKLMHYLRDEWGARLGLLVGDLAYANGYLVDWDYFGFQFEPAFTKWPLMVAAGNHEKDATGSANVPGNNAASGGECGVPYTYRFHTPAWGEAASNTLDTGRSFYSFEMGGVHFLMLDSESPSGPDSPQGQFVAADLAKVDRKGTPWLVACLHRQMVGPTTDPVNILTLQRLQADLEDLFLQYKVDLVLQGHDHAYARTCPYAKGRCTNSQQPGAQQPFSASSDPKPAHSTHAAADKSSSVADTVTNPTAPVYILAGHAGAGFTHAFPKPLPDWVIYGAQDKNGYLRVTVKGGTLTAVSVSTDDGHIMDGVKIVRTRPSS